MAILEAGKLDTKEALNQAAFAIPVPLPTERSATSGVSAVLEFPRMGQTVGGSPAKSRQKFWPGLCAGRSPQIREYVRGAKRCNYIEDS